MAYKYEKENKEAVMINQPKANRELEEVYRKAKAWDRMYDMIIDEGVTIREFDDEMYELLKQTGKTDIRIITDPSIRMEDE